MDSFDYSIAETDFSDGLLGSIGPIAENPSFLNPIDLLSDIPDFHKNFCNETTETPSSSAPGSATALNRNLMLPSIALQSSTNNQAPVAPSYSWNSYQDASSSFSNTNSCAIDLSTKQNSCTSVSSSVDLNAGSCGYFENSLLAESSAEFSVPDCAFLNSDYCSNQWFPSSVDQSNPMFMPTLSANATTQLASNPYAQTNTAIIPPQQTQYQTSSFNDTIWNTLGILPSSTTITPISVDSTRAGSSQHSAQPAASSVLQQTVTIESRYIQDKYDGYALPALGNTTSQQLLLPENDILKSGGFLPLSQANSYANNLTENCSLAPQMSYVPFAATQVFPRKNSNVSNTIRNVNNTLAAGTSVGKTNKSRSSFPLNSLQSVPVESAKQRLNWAAVFPRNHFIQPPEMIFMQPLRTRKPSTRRAIATQPASATIAKTNNTAEVPVSLGESIQQSTSSKTASAQQKNGQIAAVDNGTNLAEYFDTNSICIPMIRERNRPENRRKQKLNIIPGSENLEFEILQGRASNNAADDCMQIPATVTVEQADPYPEAELPELDEIFRRKKKLPTPNIQPLSGNKRSYTISCNNQIAADANNALNAQQAVPIKKPCTYSNKITNNNNTNYQQIQRQPSQTQNTAAQSAAVTEVSSSYEEKVSVSIAIRKGRANVAIDYDSAESDDEQKIYLQNGKSLKCRNCKKFYKSTRTLAIHSKRCAAAVKSVKDENKTNIETTFLNKPKIEQQTDQHFQPQNNENNIKETIITFSKATNGSSSDNCKMPTLVKHECCENNNYIKLKWIECSAPKTGEADANDANKPRPLTRSQTRRVSHSSTNSNNK